MFKVTWVYIQSENNVWTTGFYYPNGHFMPEGDYSSPDEAAKRVHYLNGGDHIEENERLRVENKELRTWILWSARRLHKSYKNYVYDGYKDVTGE